MRPEVALLYSGVSLDVLGKGFHEFPSELRDEIVARYPRNNFKQDFLQAYFVGFAHKPSTTYGTVNAAICERFIPGYKYVPARSCNMTRFNLHNFRGWHCASCPELITSVSDGWVEWLASEDDSGATILSGLRLVHGKSCPYDVRTVFRNDRSVVEGLSLECFVGPDDLTLLLSFLAAGELPTADVIQLARRVQIPGYELACNLVGQRNLPDVLPALLGHGCYLQSELTELIARAMNGPEAA
jgi:hypothetical protein